MSGFVKLQSSILQSTVWQEPDHIRILWITMLALKGHDGVVEASIPGLADAARITLEECENGLNRLTSPDKYSRTKAHEGRRIEEIDGGWLILNHEKYRGDTSTERVRKHREKIMKNDETLQKRSKRFETNETGETGSDQIRSDQNKKNTVAKRQRYGENFGRFWEAWPGRPKGSKENAYTYWTKTKQDRPGCEWLITAVRGQEQQNEEKRKRGEFVPQWPHCERWLKRHGWDELESPKKKGRWVIENGIGPQYPKRVWVEE
jgi:hypothetical protein